MAPRASPDRTPEAEDVSIPHESASDVVAAHGEVVVPVPDEEDDDPQASPHEDHVSPAADTNGPETEQMNPTTSVAAPSDSAAAPASGSQTWQAVWSPQYNAYYFYNSETQETTWVNPLESAEPSTSTSAPAPGDDDSTPGEDGGPSDSNAPPETASTQVKSLYALQAAAAAQGIDPSLAYLDPSLAGPSGSSGGYAHTAKFNARTGAFAKADARAPAHLGEYERAKRMSEVYFDTGAWEREVEERKRAEALEEEEGGRKRKRPTKKDLDRYKEQKKQKKIAKTAWLRT